jgi:hypothetical protein
MGKFSFQALTSFIVSNHNNALYSKLDDEWMAKQIQQVA